MLKKGLFLLLIPMLFILVSCPERFPEKPIEMIFSLVTPVQRDPDSIKDNAKILSEVAGFLDLSDCTFEYRAVPDVKGNKYPAGTQATWTRVKNLYWGEEEKYKGELSLYMLKITLYPGLKWNLDFRVKNKSGEVIYTGHWNGDSLSKTDLNARHIVELGYDNIDSSQIIDTSKTGTINLLVLSQYLTQQMLLSSTQGGYRLFDSPTRGKLSLRYRYGGSEGSELNTPKTSVPLSGYNLVLYQNFDGENVNPDCAGIFSDIVKDYLYLRKSENNPYYSYDLLGLCSTTKFSSLEESAEAGKSFNPQYYDDIAMVTTNDDEKYDVEEVMKSGYITLTDKPYGYYFFYFVYEAPMGTDYVHGAPEQNCNNTYYIWSPAVVLLNEEEVTVVVDLGPEKYEIKSDLDKMITVGCVGYATFNENTKNPDDNSFYERALVIHPGDDKRVSLTDFKEKHGCFLFFDYYDADYIHKTPSSSAYPSYKFEWIKSGKTTGDVISDSSMFCSAYDNKDNFRAGDIIKVTAIKGESVVSGTIILE